jgi:hypothetical protein
LYSPKRLARCALCCGLTLVAAAIASGQEAAAEPALRWTEQAGQSLALCDADSVIWQFNYGSGLTKPLFHPLALADSPPLTVDRPADHAWHHGLWFSWVFVNGVNYWEHDRQSGRPAGRTTWENIDVERGSDFSAKISLELAYAPAGHRAVLRESRRLRVHPPDAAGAYAIDWQCQFTAADKDVTVAVVPIPPAAEGVGWGGYGGLSIRLAEELEDRRVVTSQGEAEFDAGGVYRGTAPAADYSAVAGGVEAGVAILDHPQNPRHPSPWYAIRTNMSYLNAAVMAPGPLVITPQAPCTLRYRVVVHPGRWTAAELATAAADYAGQ